jgi:choline kinase
MTPSGCHIVLTADAPASLTEVCGISLLERWLRILQRLGFREAMILSSTPDVIEAHVARAAWARAKINATVQRHDGDVSARQLTTLGDKLLLARADSYCDPRLLEALSREEETTILDNSGGRVALLRSSWWLARVLTNRCSRSYQPMRRREPSTDCASMTSLGM